jgi:hypothetical protein
VSPADRCSCVTRRRDTGRSTYSKDALDVLLGHVGGNLPLARHVGVGLD